MKHCTRTLKEFISCTCAACFPSLQSLATGKLVPLNVTPFARPVFIALSSCLGKFLLSKIMSSQVMAHGIFMEVIDDFPKYWYTLLISFYHLHCNSTSPSSHHFIVYLMTVSFLSKRDVDPLMSPVCFLWVCFSGRRTGEEGESDGARKNPKRHVAGLLLSFWPTCLTSSVVHVMGDQEFTWWYKSSLAFHKSCHGHGPKSAHYKTLRPGTWFIKLL